MSDDMAVPRADAPEHDEEEQRRRRRMALVLLLLALLLILGLAVGHALRTSGEEVAAPLVTLTAQGDGPPTRPATVTAEPEVLSQVLADDDPGRAARQGATATPAATSTSTGTASAGTASTGTVPVSAATSEPAATGTSTSSGTSTPTSSPTPTSTSGGTPSGTATPGPTGTSTPTANPTATSTPTPTATSTPTPTATATPTPTPTPSPTGTSTPCPDGCEPCPCAADDVVLTVDPRNGAAYGAVTVTATVRSALAGSVVFLDGERSLGSSPVVGGRARLTTNALGGGEHALVALFVSDDRTVSCASAVVVVHYGGSTPDLQTVVLAVPAGAVTVTTPYTPEHPLDLGEAVLDPATSTFSASADFDDIVVTDTRAGDLGFTVWVRADDLSSSGGGALGADHLGLTQVRAVQVPGNALAAADVQVHDLVAGAPGLSEVGTLAHYPDGIGLGTARLRAVLELTDVPSSVAPGRYQGVLVFTVM